MNGFSAEVARLFPDRFIDYLVGLNDSANCNLQNFSIGDHRPCNDNELATYCQAMVQGSNRFDRFMKWKNYLEIVYDPNNLDSETISRENNYSSAIRGTNSAYYLVKNVSHDAIEMLKSRAAKCVIFGHCDLLD